MSVIFIATLLFHLWTPFVWRIKHKMTKRCNQTWYMILVTWLAATLTGQQVIRERMPWSWFREPTLIPNFWFTQSHFDWYQWLVYDQTNRYHFTAQPCISTPLWDHLIEAPSIGWWTNKQANHGINGKGWKVFPINSRWGAGVGTSDQSEHKNTVDTSETYFLVIVSLLSDFF